MVDMNVSMYKNNQLYKNCYKQSSDLKCDYLIKNLQRKNTSHHGTLNYLYVYNKTLQLHKLHFCQCSG